MVPGNRMLGRISGLKWDGIIRTVKENEMAEHVARTERNAYKVLIRKPEEKRPLRRPRLDGRLVLK